MTNHDSINIKLYQTSKAGSNCCVRGDVTKLSVCTCTWLVSSTLFLSEWLLKVNVATYTRSANVSKTVKNEPYTADRSVTFNSQSMHIDCLLRPIQQPIKIQNVSRTWQNKAMVHRTLHPTGTHSTNDSSSIAAQLSRTRWNQYRASEVLACTHHCSETAGEASRCHTAYHG